MKASGLSHGFASIITMIIGAAITEYLKKYFPAFFEILEEVGKKISYTIYSYTSIMIPSVYFVPVFVVFTLAFLWGMLYHLIRHGRKKA